MNQDASSAPQQQPADAKKEVDQAKADKERFDALKAAVDAEKQLLDARKALDAAKKTPTAAEAATAEQVAQAKTAKEIADAQKALADAQKALSDSQLAAFKSALGEVPDSGIKGTVTAGNNSGEIEAALLAMKAVREAAQSIGARIQKTIKPPASVLIMANSETPTFQNLMAYRAEVAIIDKVLDDAAATAKGVSTEGPGLEAVPLLGAAGIALDATSKLLSFFKTDYTINPVTVALEDRVALDELANHLAGLGFLVKAPAIYDGAAVNSAAQFFLDDATRLSGKRAALQPAIAAAANRIAELTKAIAAPNLPAETKATLERALATQTALSTTLKNAAGLVDSWYTKLAATDSKGTANIVHVTREKSIADALAKDAYLLLVKVQAKGGNLLTKKNLWTLFGGMPLYHMGGVAVSFTLIEGQTSLVKASGVAPVYGGFVKAGEMSTVLGN